MLSSETSAVVGMYLLCFVCFWVIISGMIGPQGSWLVLQGLSGYRNTGWQTQTLPPESPERCNVIQTGWGSACVDARREDRGQRWNYWPCTHLHVLKTQETSENTTNTSFVFLVAPKAKDTNHNSVSGTFQKRTIIWRDWYVSQKIDKDLKFSILHLHH